ncbi:MAG: GntR family transcriptional regulator [Turicibacter sp.]|nr:GntR family transcriptional regulator [Turicibacter sp.]
MLNHNLPKYLAVAQWIKQNIQTNHFKAGEKLISENQLCEKFSISRQTARQAIGILEKEGLIIKKQGSGTYVNEHLPQSKTISKNIGLITPELDDFIFPSIISGIEKVLSKNGYHTNVRLTHHKINNEREQLLSLLNSEIDGLIVEGTKSALPNPNLDLYRQFIEENIPVIFINNYYQSLDCNYILVDDEEGGRLATRYLIEQGHKRITGIFKYDDLQGNLRYKGFLTEMYQQQLQVDESTIIWYSTENMNQQFCIENLPSLLKKLNQSTAIVCYDDQIAMKLMQLLASNEQYIPKDLSIVSFNNSSLSQLATVPLSSITHPKEELGKLAAKSILKMIENPLYKIKHTYRPELIVRQSVKKI